MRFSEFRKLSIQFSMFTPQTAFSSGKIFKKLMENFGEVFDGNPTSISLPDEIPKDIPCIILTSANASLKLEVAEKRLNFFKFLRMDSSDFDQNQLVNQWMSVCDFYKDLTSAVVGRMALVQISGYQGEEPAEKLAEHFCKTEIIRTPIKRPANFEIHAHKKYAHENFGINSWVRCKTGLLIGDQKPMVLVEQDINTLNEDLNTKEFTGDEIKSFVSKMLLEHESIMKIYFP